MTELALAWLVCFRRALLAGMALGLTLSLVTSVLSASLSIVTTRTATPDGPVVVSRGVPVRTDLDGLAVRAGQSHGELSGQRGRSASEGRRAVEPEERQRESTQPARTTPRALAVPRGQLLTVETSRDPATLVTLAAYEFGVDPAWMLRVMACESRGDPEAIGDGGLAVGIFQFHARTFRANAPRIGYSMADYGSTEAQARVAALMFASGASGLWSCAR